ncbi:PREDICTED: S phase cyclin A-associated protein in the endoplasmic reticulum isoform X1 [Polistes canadensis]|uniref:S phase cyclin A-associated protein in the endoplasmic reticulum isoform X1 n=1 Tax=Polistes canadensis TaxID=91411 RepID=UPI000718CEFC|nr:PREDICTED: S phase cyclin A-associated protein in the endoplasmic reticulum isoform X1 [Polistes canadensis]
MADVRLLIQEEGRAARNLIAFNVPVGTSNTEKVTRKPPSVPRVVQSGSMKRSMKPASRVRSASTGRDKKSELQARYWAFLFGNLQRAVDGIYQTCEEDENISECKEVILVLENYTKDFHNLIEWFKVKWAYENSPPPLRRTPLAWEVRKTSPCRIWNSTIIPKSTSPLQRISPPESTCRSPIDQVISETKPMVTDNKINHIKEESLHKIIKDNKNNVSKNNSTNIKEKRKNVIERGANQSSNKERSVASKTSSINKVLVKPALNAKANGNSLIDNNKSTSEDGCDSKIKADTRNVGKQSKNSLQNISTLKILDSNLSIDKQACINNKNTKSSIYQNMESMDKTIKENETNSKLCSRSKSEITLTANKKNTELKTNDINTKATKQNIDNNESKIILENVNVDNKIIQVNNNNKLQMQNIDTTVASKNAKNTIESNNKVKQKTNKQFINTDKVDNKLINKCSNKEINNTSQAAYSTVSSRRRPNEQQTINLPETPKFIRSKTTLNERTVSSANKARPGTSVIIRRRPQQVERKGNKILSTKNQESDMNGSVEVLTKQPSNVKPKDEGDGWQTVRSRYRRGSTHNLNMSTRFHKPSTATSLPALSIESPSERNKKNCLTPDGNKYKKKCMVGKAGKNINNEVEKVKGESNLNGNKVNKTIWDSSNVMKFPLSINDTNSTSMIAAIFKSDAELLEKRIQQFMAAQAERERIILEEERKTEEADSQRSQQLSDEEASLQRQILELESTEFDIDTETDETDGEMVLEIEDEQSVVIDVVSDDISLEDRYENMLEGMSWAERVDVLAQLQALVARHPGRALELHQKLSSPSRKRSLPETLRRYQAKQACAQHKRQKLLMEKSQRLRELLNKVEDVKSAKSQLIEDKRIRMEMKLKRAEENRTQHLLEIVRKAHDEDSKLKEIAFINELEAQNKRHDFMALCQEQEERLQGIQEERQRRQEEKAAKEAAAEERRRALEAERQLRIQKMKQARREREERVGKMQLERVKERQELAREKARDREERLSALHAAQLANQEELQKKIAHKQQESARRHVENIEHIRQRAVESSILRSEEVPPTLKSYPIQKQCSLCDTNITNEVHLLSHLKGKTHLEAVRNAHDGREPSRDELQRFNIAQIRDVLTPTSNNVTSNDNKALKEKQKALKRRCRKIKQRITSRGQEWENAQKNDSLPLIVVESTNKVKFRRNLKELDRLYNYLKSSGSSIAVATLERCFGEIVRALSKSCPFDQDALRSLNGFDILTNLLSLSLNIQNSSQCLPNKSIISLCKVYKSGISGNANNIEVILSSNKVLVILDLLLQRLETLIDLDDHIQAQETIGNSTGNSIVASGVAQLLCSLIPEEPFEKQTLQSRVQDIAGYLVAGGLIDKVALHARALIEADFFLDQEHESPLLLASFDLLSRICYHLKRTTTTPDNPIVHSGGSSSGNNNNNNNSSNNNNSNENNEQTTSTETHLISSLFTSEAAGAIGALYAAVALNTVNQKGSSPTPNQTMPSIATRMLIVRGLGLLKAFAELDLQRFQNLLGSEGTSLQWRLITSQVITRLSRDPLTEKSSSSTTSNNLNTSGTYILSELFTVLGYFAVNNSENQLILQSAGAGPSVLQQFCTLPFPFYGDPRLTPYTLAALLAATHCNPEAKAILSCELSYQLLEEYRNSEEGKLNPLVRLLKDPSSP